MDGLFVTNHFARGATPDTSLPTTHALLYDVMTMHVVQSTKAYANLL